MQHQKEIFKLAQPAKKIIDYSIPHMVCCKRTTCELKNQITWKHTKPQFGPAKNVFEVRQILDFDFGHTLGPISEKIIRPTQLRMVNFCSSGTCQSTCQPTKKSGYLATTGSDVRYAFNVSVNLMRL